jgi:hypothetical protein
MPRQNELQRLAHELSRVEFAARWSHPFIVLGSFEEEMLFEFRTRAAPSPFATIPDATQEKISTLTEDDPVKEAREAGEVFPVVKSPGNPYTDRISLGRAKSCDIVLRHGHVSKLHAHFLRDPDGGWVLRDADSTNGTFRNGARLGRGELLAIHTGDMLRFGFLDTKFLDGAGLWGWLRRR